MFCLYLTPKVRLVLKLFRLGIFETHTKQKFIRNHTVVLMATSLLVASARGKRLPGVKQF